jgi:hypothetical protein
MYLHLCTLHLELSIAIRIMWLMKLTTLHTLARLVLQDDDAADDNNNDDTYASNSNNDDMPEDDSENDDDDDVVVEDDAIEPIEIEASLAMDQPQIERKVPQTESEELHELSALMMSKNAKRLYGRMQHGISKKRGEIDRLKAKRKAVEAKYNDTGGAMKKSKSKKL